jgi:sec-independent protein translocase protein TatC
MMNLASIGDIILCRGGRDREVVVMNGNQKMSFIEHLEELRRRLIVCLVAVGAGFVISYIFKERLFTILTRPLVTALPPGGKMIFTGLPEAFLCYIKVAIFSGIMLAVPVILHQMWRFVAPGLYSRERHFMLPLMVLSCLFFACGVLFGFFVVFPFAFKYLMSFGSDIIRPLPSMSQYLSLSTALLLAFGFSFELPVVLTMLAHVGLISVRFLERNRKYALLLAFVAGAVLTPTPDAINQSLLAVPLLALYEISIWGARVFGRKPEKKTLAEAVPHP